MKILPTLLCLLLLSPASGFGQPAPPSRGPDCPGGRESLRPPGTHHRPGRDGKLQKNEPTHGRGLPQDFRKRLLYRFDADGDGKLNEAERKAALEAVGKQFGPERPGKPHRWGPGHGPVKPEDRAEAQKRLHYLMKRERGRLLERFDTDGDGKLNEIEGRAARAEMKKRWEERRRSFLARFDTDGDGKLSKAEKAAARKIMAEEQARREERMRAWRKQFDANGDGKLDEAERHALRQALIPASHPPPAGPKSPQRAHPRRALKGE